MNHPQIVDQDPRTESDFQPAPASGRRFWLGWWWQPELGVHAYCDLRLSTAGMPQVIEGSFVDFVGHATVDGGIDADGWVHVRVRRSQGCIFYVGRKDADAIWLMWLIERSCQWSRRQRNCGVARIWPLAGVPTEEELSGALPDDPPESWIAESISVIKRSGHLVAELQHRAQRESDPAAGHLLTRQMEYLRRRMYAAHALNSDRAPTLSTDGPYWRVLTECQRHLDPDRREMLFARMGMESLTTYQGWRDEQLRAGGA